MSLVFVFNASSAFYHQALDFVHKIAHPSTYNCRLCQITHGNIGKKKEWKLFEDNLRTEIAYYHKDEFVQRYPNFSQVDFPAILFEENVVFTARDMEDWSLEDLKKAISKLTKSP